MDHVYEDLVSRATGGELTALISPVIWHYRCLSGV